jgi:hypothetical protein
MGSRWLLIALALCVGWASCGSEDEPQDESADPVAVSQAFIRAVAAAHPEACTALTADAADFVKVVGGEPSCEQTIQAQTRYLKSSFYDTPPAELTKELDAGHLQVTKTGANFRFCTPDEVQVKLELEQSEDGWLINSVGASYAFRTPAGSRKERRDPCDPVPREKGSM